jgi:hypothetical protein
MPRMTALVLTALAVCFVLMRTKRHHDPVEYYRGWGGYRHPIGLQSRISKDEADAFAAKGAAWLTGYYDESGRLTRAVKMYRGELFFEYGYAYHPNGRLRSARVTRGGRVTVLEFDARGRRVSEASAAF